MIFVALPQQRVVVWFADCTELMCVKGIMRKVHETVWAMGAAFRLGARLVLPGAKQGVFAMKLILKAAVAGVALMAAVPAMAADLGVPRTSFDATATSFNPWQIRLRGTVVAPAASGRVTDFQGTGPLAGSNFGVTTSVVPTLDITYYFTRNFAAELILGVTPHTVYGRGPVTGALGRVADTWLLPPTLTFQYHFTDFGAFKPYVGVGVNYTVFFSNKSRVSPLNPPYDRVSISGAAGLALQAGFDYMIDRNWGINVDVKKLFLSTNATFTDTTAPVTAPTRARVTIDPWIISTGITYKF